MTRNYQSPEDDAMATDTSKIELSAEDFGNFWAQADTDTEHKLLVTGNSMWPFLKHKKSYVFIEKKDQYHLKKGDIALFQRPRGTIVLHRIIDVFPNGNYLANGDAQVWTEEVAPEFIRAIVTKICRTKRLYSVDWLPYKALSTIWRLLFPRRRFILRYWGGLRRRYIKYVAKNKDIS